MRALALCLIGCGRIAFDPTGGGTGGDADPPLPDAATFTAPCDVATQVGIGDALSGISAAAEAGLYRATWIDTNQLVSVLGIERTGDAIAANTRTFGGSAFLPTPMGSDVAISAGRTVSIVWGTSQTEIRQLVGAQLSTGRATSYTALATDLGGGADRMYMLTPGGDLRVRAIDAAMLQFGTSALVDMQMTERQRVIPAAGALITAARPNADDCTVWSYTSTLGLLGSTDLPADMNSCEEIAAAYAPLANQRAVAYTYLAGTVSTVVAQAITDAAAPGARVPIAGGTDPQIASGGMRFRLGYRAASGVVRIATLSPDLGILSDVELHPTPVRRFALASNEGEVVAIYATTSTPNEIWIKRFCGP